MNGPCRYFTYSETDRSLTRVIFLAPCILGQITEIKSISVPLSLSGDAPDLLDSVNEPTFIPTKLVIFTRKSQSDRRYEISWNTDLTKGEWIGCVRRWITVPFHTDNVDGGKNGLMKSYTV